MRVIHTIDSSFDSLPQWDRDQIYNGLDCCVTYDVFNALNRQLDLISQDTYEFSRQLQGPVLEMGFRGVLVDKEHKDDVIEELYETIDTLSRNLERIVLDGIGLNQFNWRSSSDLRNLFYDELCLPTQRNKGRPTVDRNAREKLGYYPIAAQICKHINVITDLEDKLSVLRTQIDKDSRIRTTYNIAGTNTGRFSSSEDVFGEGTNMQNITESLRSILISDPGMKFAKFDARSGESFCVGAIEWNLFQDGKYLDVCETGDPHTAVARIMWPGLGWSGDIRRDKDVAEEPYYRHHTYRFMCKKLGHGSNYGGKPQTLAQEAQVGLELVKAFQPIYFQTFPAHQIWHEWLKEQVRTKGQLTSLTGRRRHFHGRRTDDKTLREALAYDPQCGLADIVNRAMLRIWRLNPCPIMMQDHDALTFMYHQTEEQTIIPYLVELLPESLKLSHGRTMTIPYDLEVGWNKGKFHPEKNPNGLKAWEGYDDRRQEKWSTIRNAGSRVGSRPSLNNAQRSIPPTSGADGQQSRSWRRR
jgi:DNA polymerase I-like protein with 3'-5' exonuclease and polymerase domains